MALGSHLIAFWRVKEGALVRVEPKRPGGRCSEGGNTFHPKPSRAEVRFGAGRRREGSSAAPAAPADQAITGRPLIGRHPSAHKPTMPFLLAFFSLGFSAKQSRPPARAASLAMGEGESQRSALLRLLEQPSTPPPPAAAASGLGVPRSRPCRALPQPPRGAPEAAGPAHVAGGPERGARRPPHNGDRGRPRAPPPPHAPRAPGAPEGSRTGLPGGGRGEERGPSSSSGRGGYLTPPRQLHSVVPATPRDEQPQIWVSRPSPARPLFPHTHPWTPFSLLPSRSLNVRLPLAFPLGAALRRRETRNLGRYHRARPRG